jgi:truncated hemoglobin YjbI
LSNDSEIVPDQTSAVTLFDKYGDVQMVVKLVRDFQKEVLLRPHLAHYFHEFDSATLTKHSILYLSYALGKPAEEYTGREMQEVHSKFQITGLHFDEVSDVLKDTLLAGGVSKVDVETVITHIDKTRQFVVTT